MFDNVFCDTFGTTFTYKSIEDAICYFTNNNFKSIKIPNNNDEFSYFNNLTFFTSLLDEKDGDIFFKIKLKNNDNILSFKNIVNFQTGFSELSDRLTLNISKLNFNFIYNETSINYLEYSKIKGSNIDVILHESHITKYDTIKIVFTDSSMLELDDVIKYNELSYKNERYLIVETKSSIYYINNISLFFIYNSKDLVGEHQLNFTYNNNLITIKDIKRTYFSIENSDFGINFGENDKFHIYYKNDFLSSASISNQFIKTKTSNNKNNLKIINI
jgi:hypothetical protein